VRYFCIHDIDAWREALGLYKMRLLASWVFWPILRVVYILYSSFSHFSLGYTTSPVAAVLPVPSPARTRDGRVEPPERIRFIEFTCSGEGRP
jgi:hypothetical protein